MMKTTLVTALLSSWFFAGCVSELAEPHQLSPAAIEDVEVVVIDCTDPLACASAQVRPERPAAEARDMFSAHGIDDDRAGSGDEPSRLPDGPCDCQDQACRSSWIAENLGCGLCASFICTDSEPLSTCNYCE